MSPETALTQDTRPTAPQRLDFGNAEARLALLDWWGALREDSGGRAALRRCKRPVDAAFLPAYHQLRERLAHLGAEARRVEPIAILAAHIRETRDSPSFAEQLAGRGAERPVLSDLRFRKILRLPDHESLIPGIVRVLRMLEGKTNLIDLATGVYHWDERVKRDWAFHYYSNLKSTTKEN